VENGQKVVEKPVSWPFEPMSRNKATAEICKEEAGNRDSVPDGRSETFIAGRGFQERRSIIF
jgi:hypothetical protein